MARAAGTTLLVMAVAFPLACQLASEIATSILRDILPATLRVVTYLIGTLRTPSAATPDHDNATESRPADSRPVKVTTPHPVADRRKLRSGKLARGRAYLGSPRGKMGSETRKQLLQMPSQRTSAAIKVLRLILDSGCTWHCHPHRERNWKREKKKKNYIAQGFRAERGRVGKE